jgi:hypothetical protein
MLTARADRGLSHLLATSLKTATCTKRATSTTPDLSLRSRPFSRRTSMADGISTTSPRRIPPATLCVAGRGCSKGATPAHQLVARHTARSMEQAMKTPHCCSRHGAGAGRRGRRQRLGRQDLELRAAPRPAHPARCSDPVRPDRHQVLAGGRVARPGGRTWSLQDRRDRPRS